VRGRFLWVDRTFVWNLTQQKALVRQRRKDMTEDTKPEFKTHKTGREDEAPNWPNGAPQINGPRTSEDSDFVENGKTKQLDEADS
jgi:hypothetical protein